jgi:hypothetical protein
MAEISSLQSKEIKAGKDFVIHMHNLQTPGQVLRVNITHRKKGMIYQMTIENILYTSSSGNVIQSGYKRFESIFSLDHVLESFTMYLGEHFLDGWIIISTIIIQT